jgi:hypothetical protein
MAALYPSGAHAMTSAAAVVAQSFVSAHSIHLLSVALPAVALAVFAAGADLRSRARTRVRERIPFRASRPLTVAAAGCGVIATAVHIDVAPGHFHEAMAFGVFFVVTAACQLGWSALMLMRHRAWVTLAGAVGNTAVVALWLYTRAIAVPIGPDAGRPEAIGALDIVATLAETSVVVLAMWIIVDARRRCRTQTNLDAPSPGQRQRPHPARVS